MTYTQNFMKVTNCCLQHDFSELIMYKLTPLKTMHDTFRLISSIFLYNAWKCLISQKQFFFLRECSTKPRVVQLFVLIYKMNKLEEFANIAWGFNYLAGSLSLRSPLQHQAKVALVTLHTSHYFTNVRRPFLCELRLSRTLHRTF